MQVKKRNSMPWWALCHSTTGNSCKTLNRKVFLWTMPYLVTLQWTCVNITRDTKRIRVYQNRTQQWTFVIWQTTKQQKYKGASTRLTFWMQLDWHLHWICAKGISSKQHFAITSVLVISTLGWHLTLLWWQRKTSLIASDELHLLFLLDDSDLHFLITYIV